MLSAVDHLVKFKEAAKDGNLVPLDKPIFSDHLTPMLAYRCLVKEDDREAPSFLFESVEPGLNASNIAHAEFNFEAICFCLAMNYLDRFLSVYDLPRGKTWAIQLVVVACLSLAAKTEQIEVPFHSGLTGEIQIGLYCSSSEIISPDEKMAAITGFSPSKTSHFSWSPKSGDSYAADSLSRLDIRCHDPSQTPY